MPPVARRVGDEVHLAERLAAAVPPEIEPMLVLRGEVVVLRNDEPVRLHAAVDLRLVAANDRPGLRGPGRLAGLELLRSFQSRRENLLHVPARILRSLAVVDLVVIECPANRLLVDEHVRKQFVLADVLDEPLKFGQSLLDLVANRVGNLGSPGRHGADVIGNVVGGPIGRGREGEGCGKQTEGESNAEHGRGPLRSITPTPPPSIRQPRARNRPACRQARSCYSACRESKAGSGRGMPSAMGRKPREKS